METLITLPELVDIELLKPHPQNYRKHVPDQMAHLVESIKKNGVYKNVVAASDLTILAGHGVWEACTIIGLKQVPVVRLNILPDDKRALKILTGDNEISNLGEVDDRLLSELLRDIAVSQEGLLGTGFDEQQLANLVFVTRHADEIKDANAAAEWVGLPGYQDKDDSKDNEPSIIIRFETPEDRTRFVEKIQLQIREKRSERTWSTIWPYQERNDLKSVRFEDKGQ